MIYQAEVWRLLEDDEYNQVWDKVYQDFDFTPSININIIPFKFKVPADIYDISSSLIWYDNVEINEKI